MIRRYLCALLALPLLGCAEEPRSAPITVRLHADGIDLGRVSGVAVAFRFTAPTSLRASRVAAVLNGIPVTGSSSGGPEYLIEIPGNPLLAGDFAFPVYATLEITAPFVVGATALDRETHLPFASGCARSSEGGAPLAFGAAATVVIALRPGTAPCEPEGGGGDGGTATDGGTPSDGGANADGGAGLPSTPTVVISPPSPTTTDALSAEVTTPSIDPEGAPVTYTYAWYKNGFLEPDLTGPRVGAERTVRAQTWRVEVTPLARGVAGAPGVSAPTVIRNTPPTLTGVGLYPLRPILGDTLYAAPFGAFDPDEAEVGAMLDFVYQWYRVDPDGGPDVLLTGETFSYLGTRAGFSSDDRVRVGITPSDGAGSGPTLRSCPRTLRGAQSPSWDVAYPVRPWIEGGASGLILDPGRRRLLLHEHTGKTPASVWWEYRLETPRWELGSPWHRLEIAPAPGDFPGAVVSDPRTGIGLVVGGVDASSSFVNAVWALDLAHGCEAAAALVPADPSGPAGRLYQSAIVDARSRVVLFGGYDDSGSPGTPLGDTWTVSLDPIGTWSLTGNGASPPARFLHGAIYDPDEAQMIVYGGIGGLDNGRFQPALQDVWALSLGEGASETWRQVSYLGTAPSGRFGAGVAYDPARQALVVAGGCPAATDVDAALCESGGLADVHLLSLAPGAETWNAPPVTGEGPIGYISGMVHDAFTGAFYVRSIEPRGIALHRLSPGATWTWTPLWRTSDSPAGRRAHGAVLAVGPPSRLDVFLGTRASTALDDAWRYELETGSWKPLLQQGDLPGKRHSFAMGIYQYKNNEDAVSEQYPVYLHGGKCDAGVCGDTYHLYPDVQESLRWTRWPPDGGAPTARSGHAGASNEYSSGGLRLLGGVSGDGGAPAARAWEFLNGSPYRLTSDARWTQGTSSPTPPPQVSEAAMVYDPRFAGTGRYYLFGGISVTGTSSNAVWSSPHDEEPNASWAVLTPSGTPPAPRYGHRATLVGPGQILVSGGYTAGVPSPSREVWLLTCTSADGGAGISCAWSELTPAGGFPSFGFAQHAAKYEPFSKTLWIFGGATERYVDGTSEVWSLRPVP